MRIGIPPSDYKNHYELARFELTWNLTLILIFFLPILAILLFFLERAAAYPTALATLVCLLAAFMLKRSGKYKLTAKLYTISGLSLNLFSLLFFPNALHFADPVWMMIVLLFAYFTLGKRWGTVMLIISIIGSTVFILFFFNTNLNHISNAPTTSLIALAINFSICAVIVAFLIFQFFKLNKYAEVKYVTLTSELKNKNSEKDVLLKEIHHRVKNNLQVIISLLRLQEASQEDESNASFSDTIDRIRSMSLIHEKMYQTEDFANIDLEEYLETLINDIIDSSSIKTQVRFSIDSNINTIKMKSLVPLALIFNELISNSIKHAFKNKSNGNIRIEIASEEKNIKVIYSDNGVWTPPAKENSLGMELINALTDQLSGRYHRTTKDGTCYTFHFNYDN